MRTFLLLLGAPVVLIVAFIIWRYVATVRGGLRRTEELASRIAPVVRAVQEGLADAAARVRALAADPATRTLLHDELLEANRLDLFPKEFATPEALAESDLVFWLRHPNELAASPDEVELKARATRSLTPGAEWTYFLFRYRTKPPHWAADDGWMAGVAGPYGPNGEAVTGGPAGTFSTFLAYDSKPPDEHIDFSHALAVKYCSVEPPAEAES